MTDKKTPSWIMYLQFFISGAVLAAVFPFQLGSPLLLSYDERLLRILLPVLATTISIIFLIITFILGQYSNQSLDVDKDPFAFGILIMILALLFSTVALFSGGVALWFSSSLAFSFSVALFVLEVVTVVMGIGWLTQCIVGIKAMIAAFRRYVQ
jgi:hypothetical protein